MANDKVRFEFQVDKAIGCAECLRDGAVVDKDVLLRVLCEGRRPVELVSDDTNNSQVANKSDTIEIDRAVAEAWIESCNDTLILNKAMAVEVKKALSEGRNS